MKLLGCLIVAVYLVSCQGLTEDEFVTEINAKANGMWVAMKTGIKEEDVIPILGSLDDPNLRNLPIKTHEDDGKQIPKEFDARKQWPQCKSIGLISDQANCGSCWAMGAAGAMSDRLCIFKHVQTLVSPYDIMTCCGDCGNGCEGGYPSAAWSYWEDIGIVSGGLYGDNSTCQPYGLPHCDHHCHGKYPPCKGLEPTPACEKKCVNGKTYNDDKSHGKSPYTLPNDVKTIQRELMKNGPVEVSFQVYADFEKYSSGIYKHVSGSLLGGHAVRMIGWGEDNGTPYWLIANSWNEDWGEKGLFRILRGKNECGIESNAVASIPR